MGVGSDATVGQVVSPLDVEEHPSGALSFDPSAPLLGSLSLRRLGMISHRKRI